MRASNLVVLRGRTTADVEVKVSSNDVHYCNFTLAVDRPYRKGEERETDFVYVTAYRSTADFMAKNVAKGTMIAITGEVRVRSWEDNDGKRRSRMEIVADQVEFSGPKTSKEDTPKETAANIPDDGGDDDLPF